MNLPWMFYFSLYKMNSENIVIIITVSLKKMIFFKNKKIYISQSIQTDPDDPCKAAFILENMDQRIKENHIHDGSLMLCDRYSLGNGHWARADAQDLLQTEPKTHEWCGTRYPIWMKGGSSWLALIDI